LLVRWLSVLWQLSPIETSKHQLRAAFLSAESHLHGRSWYI
jgi:hypothetical protein